jgi:hypothetical protein
MYIAVSLGGTHTPALADERLESSMVWMMSVGRI